MADSHEFQITPVAKEIPSIDDLSRVLSYDPKTGFCFWKERDASYFKNQGWCNNWNARHAGARAGASVRSDGYLTIRIFGSPYLTHRIAYALATGVRPPLHLLVDHIDGDVANNKAENLRLATRSDNNHNRTGVRPDSTSGIRCVYPVRNGFVSNIKVNRKAIYVGRFDTKESAAVAAIDAMKKHYGEYANTRIYRKE